MRFAEILDAKLRDKSLDDIEVEAHRTRADLPSSTGPSPLWTQLFRGNLGPLLGRTTPLKHAYPASSQKTQTPVPASPTPQPPAPEQAEPSVLVESLSQTEKQGLQFLILKGARNLSVSFTRSQLRKEYRKLLKALHPDHHHAFGAEATATASHEFLKLQEAKLQLQRLFKDPV